MTSSMNQKIYRQIQFFCLIKKDKEKIQNKIYFRELFFQYLPVSNHGESQVSRDRISPISEERQLTSSRDRISPISEERQLTYCGRG